MSEASAENTVDNGNAVLEESVNIASDLLTVNRDQKNAAITLAGMTQEERDGVRSFINRVKAQQNASKNVYGLVMAKAKERNAGKPKRDRSKKPADTAADTGKAKK